MAQIAQNVYDTPTGKYLLLPQGSRLVGAYSSDVSYGQARVLVAWQRIIFPDGKAMDIGTMPGAIVTAMPGLLIRSITIISGYMDQHFYCQLSRQASRYNQQTKPGKLWLPTTECKNCFESSARPTVGTSDRTIDCQKPQYFTHPGNQARLSIQRHCHQRHDIHEALSSI